MDEQTAPRSTGPFSAEDIKAHAEHDHIAAVFADRDHAEAAVEELRALGLGSEHLGVAVHSSDTVVFEHDTDHEMVHDLEVGAAVGVPVGFLGYRPRHAGDTRHRRRRHPRPRRRRGRLGSLPRQLHRHRSR